MAEISLKRLDEIAYVSFDPGETTGYATFTAQGDVIEYGQFKLIDQTKWLTVLISNVPNLKAVITEDYRNHGWQQQKRWSRNQTSKNIGKIEIIAELRGVPCHLQPNTVKAIGYKWAGMNGAPSNHAISHQFDAVAHGKYWLVQHNICSSITAIPKNER